MDSTDGAASTSSKICISGENNGKYALFMLLFIDYQYRLSMLIYYLFFTYKDNDNFSSLQIPILWDIRHTILPKISYCPPRILPTSLHYEILSLTHYTMQGQIEINLLVFIGYFSIGREGLLGKDVGQISLYQNDATESAATSFYAPNSLVSTRP